MTTTPTIWKLASTVNLNNTTGLQDQPSTIGLADGRFLATWVDAANNIGIQAGTDIYGQIYSAEGNTVGVPFLLNSTFFVDNETDPAIAALPDGGFVVVYEDNDISTPGQTDIRFDRFNPQGTSIANGTIASGTTGGATNQVSNPSVAVSANGDFVVTFERNMGGNEDVRGVVVNGATNVVGPVFSAAQNGADDDTFGDVAVLTSGRIVSVFEEDDAGTSSIEFKLLTPAGDTLVALPSGLGEDPHVAALTGGGFVMVWEDPANFGDIRAEVRNNLGGVVTSNFLISVTPNALQNEPDVIGLKDGGFYVVWDQGGAGLVGARYSSTGVLIGTQVSIFGSANPEFKEPELGLTDDGRILVSFRNASGEISEMILDPRDNLILGDGTSETITSRTDGASIFGSGGNDLLLGQGATDVLYGGTGSDTLMGGLSSDTLVGEDGNDLLAAGPGGDDTLNGGVGEDVAAYDLLSASATVTGTGNSWTMTAGPYTDALYGVEVVRFVDRSVRLRETTDADLNGNATADIIWRNTDGSALVWNQNGGNTTKATNLGNPGTQWRIDGTGDFNADGTGDLVWRNTQDGNVAIWNMADGQYAGGTSLGVVGGEWQIAGTGDFDRDGDADLLWRNGQDGNVLTWEMEDSSVAGLTNHGLVGAEWSLAGTGDFDRDGDSDLLWRNGQDGTILTWAMEPGQAPVSSVVAQLDLAWTIQDTGDFDADGDSDILFRHTDGSVAIWTLQDGQYAGSSHLGAVGQDWAIQDARDYTGDATADIMWRNQDGTVVLWGVQNAQATASATVAQVTNDWQIVG